MERGAPCGGAAGGGGGFCCVVRCPYEHGSPRGGGVRARIPRGMWAPPGGGPAGRRARACGEGPRGGAIPCGGAAWGGVHVRESAWGGSRCRGFTVRPWSAGCGPPCGGPPAWPPGAPRWVPGPVRSSAGVGRRVWRGLPPCGAVLRRVAWSSCGGPTPEGGALVRAVGPAAGCRRALHVPRGPARAAGSCVWCGSPPSGGALRVRGLARAVGACACCGPSACGADLRVWCGPPP